jgi:hypothetical protein
MTKRKSNKKKRPIAVTLIAWVTITMILLRFFWVGQTVFGLKLFQNQFSLSLWGSNGVSDAGLDFIYGVARLVLGLIGIIVLIAFLRMRRWSWVALVMWVGLSLTIGLVRYFFSKPGNFTSADYFVLASDTVLAFLLNQADVQRIFGIRSDTGERLI